jgi:phosphotransferase system HPr (HPr) family protein
MHLGAVVEAELTLENPVGLHARPAAVFVRLVASLPSRVTVANLDRDPDDVADGRSILAVLGLGASRGARIRITVDGPSEVADLAAIRRLVESGLGESLAERS